MSEYDPASDPRHVPGIDQLPESEREFMQGEIETLVDNIQRFDQALVMFATPGWEVLMDGLARTADELDTQLLKEKDPSSWKFYRGQKAQVDWFRSLPVDMANKQRQLRRDYAGLVDRLGKG